MIDFCTLLSSAKFDRIGRRYPYRVILHDGSDFIGLYAGSSSRDGTFEQIWFKTLDSPAAWYQYNLSGKMIYLKPEEISAIEAWS